MQKINSIVLTILLSVLIAKIAGCGSGGDQAATDKPPAPTIFFAGTFDDARAEAQASGKPLLVAVTAAWAPPCRQLDETTWIDPAVVSWVQANVVAVKVDLDKDAETAGLMGYKQPVPIMIIYKNGAETSRTVGYLAPADMLAWLQGAA